MMGMSLNGDRAVTGESGITSPGIYYYDATVGTFQDSGVNAGVYAVTVDRAGGWFGAGGTIFDGATFASVGAATGLRTTVSPAGTRAYSYLLDGTTPTLRTYDISGSSIGPAVSTSLAVDPGSDGTNPLLTSLDGGTLFINGANGIVVMTAP
jgi:hypothetical protein